MSAARQEESSVVLDREPRSVQAFILPVFTLTAAAPSGALFVVQNVVQNIPTDAISPRFLYNGPLVSD
jgi:hypothetical protein